MGQLSDRAREQRRVILVLTDEAARSGRRDERLVDFFDDDEVAVISIPGSLSWDDPLLRHLSMQNRLRPGELLIQSPYNPSRYEFADSALTEFAVAKFMLLTKVCQRLGATSVKVDKVNAAVRNEQVSAEINGSAVVESATLGADRTLSRTVRERLELEDSFPGGEADVDGARQLLWDAGLAGDTTLESLIDMRAVGNALSRREIKLSLTEESSHNLHVAARYSGLKAIRVGGDFKRQVEQNIDVVLQATITFAN